MNEGRKGEKMRMMKILFYKNGTRYCKEWDRHFISDSTPDNLMDSKIKNTLFKLYFGLTIELITFLAGVKDKCRGFGYVTFALR